MKNVLITGGTGFLGSALTHKLVSKGYNVTIFDNDYRGKVSRLQNIHKDIEFLKGDIRDPESIINACKNKDVVFHLAYINGTEYFYSKPELVLEVGVKGMINVLDGCIKYKVPELFLASSSEVYNEPPIIPTPENVPMIIPDPLNPRFSYGGGKIISELMVINYGRKHFKRAIIFRPHNVYGPDMGGEHVIPQFSLRMNELKKINGNKIIFPIQGTGKETRAYIYVDDFIDGIDLLLRKGKHLEIYNVGTEIETTTKMLAQKIGKLFNCTITIQPGKLQPGSTTKRLADITKIKKLGFKENVTLDEGLKKTVEWYIQSGQKE